MESKKRYPYGAVGDDTIDEATADIRRALRPLKKGRTSTLRPFVAGIVNLATVVLGMHQTPVKEIKRLDRKFKKALADLGDDSPLAVRASLQANLKFNAEQRLAARRDVVGVFFASNAIEIVAKFSEQRPVSTKDGNIHTVAKIIFRAATGREPSNTAFLKAIRRSVTGRHQNRA